MLRITTLLHGPTATARLEGRLCGPWVAELARWWEGRVQADGRAPLTVDLSDVAFVDAKGKALLERMCRAGVTLRASGCMTRAVLEEVLAAARRPGDATSPGGAAGEGA